MVPFGEQFSLVLNVDHAPRTIILRWVFDKRLERYTSVFSTVFLCFFGGGWGVEEGGGGDGGGDRGGGDAGLTHWNHN